MYEAWEKVRANSWSAGREGEVPSRYSPCVLKGSDVDDSMYRRSSARSVLCEVMSSGRSSGAAVQAEIPNRPQDASVKSRGGERCG